MPGIRIRHKFHRGTILYLVPVFKKPFPKPKVCPLCKTAHFCKTVHLHLVEGHAVVSTGVLGELQMAGMPDLEVVETIAHPPGLSIGTVGRAEQNQTNQRITQWGTTSKTSKASWLPSALKSKRSTPN